MIDVDGAIAWREAGPTDGEPVAFLHGLGGSRLAWDPQLAAIAARGWRAAAWDMPGYGASEDDLPRTFGRLVEAFERWLDALDVESVHLVGLSLGGMIAQHAALSAPTRLRSLMLLDTSPAFGFDGSVTADEWLAQRLAPLHAGETPATIAPAVLHSIMAPDAPPDALTAAVAAMQRIPSAGLAAAARCLVTHDLRGQLGEISAPTLVAVGSRDAETPRPYAEYLAHHIPGAHLHVIAGAGHISNLERPHDVNRLLVDFIAAHLTAPPHRSG